MGVHVHSPPSLLVDPPEHCVLTLRGLGGVRPGPMNSSCMKVRLHFVSCSVFWERALTNWASQGQETFSGDSQGVLAGCRAGLGLDHASLGVSCPSCGEADEAVGGPGWDCQTPAPPDKCVMQKKNRAARLLVIGQKRACLCRAQENSRLCLCFMAESKEKNKITGW